MNEDYIPIPAYISISVLSMVFAYASLDQQKEPEESTGSFVDSLPTITNPFSNAQAQAPAQDQAPAQVDDQAQDQAPAQVDDQAQAPAQDQVPAQVDSQVQAQVDGQGQGQAQGQGQGQAVEPGFLPQLASLNPFSQAVPVRTGGKLRRRQSKSARTRRGNKNRVNQTRSRK